MLLLHLSAQTEQIKDNIMALLHFICSKTEFAGTLCITADCFQIIPEILFLDGHCFPLDFRFLFPFSSSVVDRVLTICVQLQVTSLKHYSITLRKLLVLKYYLSKSIIPRHSEY